jgi:hypothetical protein
MIKHILVIQYVREERSYKCDTAEGGCRDCLRFSIVKIMNSFLLAVGGPLPEYFHRYHVSWVTS